MHNICQEDTRFSLYIHQVSDWGGDRITSVKEEMINHELYSEALERLKNSVHKFNYYVHYDKLNSESCVCYANKLNNFIVGADGIVYKCSGNFEIDSNRIGYISKDGIIKKDEVKEALWIFNNKRVMKKCKSCFFSGSCLAGFCPARMVRNLEASYCSFEKEYLGHFLELFGKAVFKIIE